jgi:predicted RNA binding protein YcfA (HicA-like mRNA interferase family)
MSERLPALKGRDIIKALKRAGFIERHASGSHVILRHPVTKKIATVPVHGGKDVKRGTLFSIIRQAGLSVESFKALLS